jgi:hypothetical protein
MQNAKCKMQKFNTRTRTVCALFAFCILNFAFLGCASRAKAVTLTEGPPLAVPTPPAHEIVVEEVAEAPPPEPPPAPEPTPPAPRPTATRPPARNEPRETPAPAAAPPPPTTPPPTTADAPAVRAAPATQSAGEERKVRDLMAKAAGDLKNVDYQRLSKEGKAQYDQSKRFSDEAQQAIKERNFLLALTLAEKAATLAAELVR